MSYRPHPLALLALLLLLCPAVAAQQEAIQESLEGVGARVLELDDDSPIHLLAWQVLEDHRQRRIEHCLVLQERPGQRGYLLAHLVRRPLAEDPSWSVPSTHVTVGKDHPYFPGRWFRHLRRFDQRPTNDQIYAALEFEGVDWSFEPQDPWKLLAAAVEEDTWHRVLGERPTRFFPDPP